MNYFDLTKTASSLKGIQPWTGRDGKNAVHARPGNLRTAVIVEDGGPCKVRQIREGDCRGLWGLPGTAGDYV